MKHLFYSLATLFLLAPVVVLGQENFLVAIPGINTAGENGTFNQYINAIYVMFISIAALIAVIKIIIAGVKYMFSDIVTQKSDAKNDIKGALLGLLVVLSAVVILTVINPDLTNFNPNITRNDAAQPVTNTQGTVSMVSCTERNTTCAAYTCISIDCRTEAQNCTSDGGVPFNERGALVCVTPTTGRVTEDSLPSREITCESTVDAVSSCRAERELCREGGYFNGRLGRVEDTEAGGVGVDGQYTGTFVCQALLTAAEEEGQQEQFVENITEDANLRRCEDPNDPSRRYWWDTDSSRCRVNNFTNENLQEPLPPSISELQDTSWLPFTELRVLDPENPDDYEGITRLCRTEYASVRLTDTNQTSSVEYNPITQSCSVTYIRTVPTQELAPVTEQPPEYRQEWLENQQ